MRVFVRVGVLFLSVLAACSGALPSEREIDESLEATLRSVSGDWVGTSSGVNALRLDFRLQEGTGGAVSGSGTMREGASTPVPITVTGTFQRPLLTLTIGGMTYEGQSVQGNTSGNYTTVGGIATTLQLTAPAFSRSLPLLLQEN